MKTRKIIFTPFTFNPEILNEEDQKIAASVKEGLDYINRFHYNKYKTIKNEYLKLQQQIESQTISIKEQARLTKYLLFIQDIKKREQFTTMLSDASQQARLSTALQKQWENIKSNEITQLRQKKANANDIQNRSREIDEEYALKKQELSNLFTDFKRYSRFAHLTAEDLAVVSVMVDALIGGIKQSSNKITNKELLQTLITQEKVLTESKLEIQACMEQHKAIYLKNNPEESNEAKKEVDSVDLSASCPSLMRSAVNVSEKELLRCNNDILFPLRQQINNLFGKEVLDEHLSVWVDSSLTQNFPILPFEEKQTLKGTIYGYFNRYNQPATPTFFGSFLNYISSYGQWFSDYAKGFWSTGTEQLNKLAFVTHQSLDVCSEKIVETYEYYFNPVAYHIKKYEHLVAEIKEHQEERKAPKSFEQHLIENPLNITPPSPTITRTEGELIEQDWIVVEQNAIKKQKLDNWQKVIKLFLAELKTEHHNLKDSCIGGLFANKLAIKEAKINELETFLPPAVQDWDALMVRARIAKQKPSVISGRHSRTEEILDSIIADQSPQRLLDRYRVKYDEKAYIMCAKYSRAVF